MLLTITTTHTPATDLGYLLHKNPTKVQQFDLSFGAAYFFYTDVHQTQCTAAMLIEVDPIGLVRNNKGPAGENFALRQYVNDRPYAASSFMSVAIAQVLGSALQGRSRDRQQMADTPIPLVAKISALPCRGGEQLLRSLFEPLGYRVSAVASSLNPQFPNWGLSYYFTVELQHTLRLKELLSHLYVLLPVLDNDKHYWIGEDEIEKLLRHGEGWLTLHPERELISRRYLRHRPSLTRIALARLMEEEKIEEDPLASDQEAEIERPVSLHTTRLELVKDELLASGATRVLDLGCGEGRLLELLANEPQFQEIIGCDVSHRALELAERKLRKLRLLAGRHERIRLIHGSLLYRDARIFGFDAAAVVEVIEHLDPPRLAAFQRVLFQYAHPRLVILTTPNSDYNVKFPTLPAGQFRHSDHRFEWSRKEFSKWAMEIAEQYGYQVVVKPVGQDDPDVGAPTQMALFTSITSP